MPTDRDNIFAQYFIELPNLRYDKIALLAIASELEDRWSKWRRPNGEFSSYDELRCEHFDQYPAITEIVAQLNPSLKIYTARMAFVRLPPNHHLTAHLDTNRQAALIMPLCPDEPAPVYYIDENGHEVISHRYNAATIMHAQRLHGVRNTAAVRINFQFSIYHSWDQLLDMVAADQILAKPR